MPTSLIEIIAPVVVLSRMPPVGPGMSLIMSAFCRRRLQRNARDGRMSCLASGGTSAALAGETTDPDRIIRIALFKFDPHARTDERHE